MCLRTDGDDGLIAMTTDTFIDYQKTNAWTWEHQAITRARFVTGAKRIGDKSARLRREILLTERQPEKLKQDILSRRNKIEQGHPTPTELLEIKHARGGMVDVDFITQ